ncbi:glycosyltransferase family 2 protein [Methyloceanibacter sp.]|uniref:glycosyltransferase family 2 protein n=1 Tax=Methyloceanibacter sp. TaxID=1965321 RepID=UPI003D6C7B81
MRQDNLARHAESVWAQHADAPPLCVSDYEFLLERFVDRATLHRAEALAKKWGVLPHAVMIANGWLSASDYYQALARACGVPFRGEIGPHEVSAPASLRSPRECLARGVLKERAGGGAYVFAPEKLRPNAVEEVLARLAPHCLSLASPEILRQAVCGHFAQTFAAASVDGLHARFPDRSAKTSLTAWQRLLLFSLLLGFAAALGLHAQLAFRALSLALVVIFLPVIALRVFAACDLLRRTPPKDARPRMPDAELPVYTILVPLYREANMLASLTSSLARLDYPAAKLDIKLILEAVDAETIAVARRLHLPGNVEIVVVPDIQPRTKPKALNYALPLARGEYLVIYDAEDRPERDQLRKAIAAFQEGPPTLACLQAKLDLYNATDNWLTRQFTIEYDALFDGLLPALDRLQLPIPLGGTSNHFRVSALKWLMAWDPFNVTEDADLGTRLARSRYLCQVLDSMTFEEAPPRLSSWFPQRTRWIKGYMQTWFVHMRQPGRLWRELGAAGFLGFQVMIGGTVLSALVHPWFYALAAFDLAQGAFLAWPGGWLGLPFWLLASLGLGLGYLASMMLGFLALKRRGVRDLLSQVPLMPFYWLLISGAAYRAAWQFATDPFTWEKTEHGLSHGIDLPHRR